MSSFEYKHVFVFQCMFEQYANVIVYARIVFCISNNIPVMQYEICLLYTSDAADE